LALSDDSNVNEFSHGKDEDDEANYYDANDDNDDNDDIVYNRKMDAK